MLACRTALFFFASVAVSQCFAHLIEMDVPGEKRQVPMLHCDKLVDSQNLQIVTLNQLDKRGNEDDFVDMLSPRSSFKEDGDSIIAGQDILLGTRDVMLRRDAEVQSTTGAAPFLGYSGQTYEDHNIFGGTNSSSSGLVYEFYECDYSDFMGYKAHSSEDGTKFQYGHVVVTNTGKCLQASKLAKRNQVLVEGDCPSMEDSGQFASFFEFRTQVKRDSSDSRLSTTFRSLKFLGKPEGELYDIKGQYKTSYDSDSQKVRIDYQKHASQEEDGQEVVFIMPAKRSGK